MEPAPPLALFLLAALSCTPRAPPSAGPPASAPTAPPPAIVLIVVDTLRRDHLGCYGYARPTTPTLDRLAAESTRYDDVRSAAPWTTPSVGALLTSQFPTALAIHATESPLPDGFATLPELLRDAGWSTAAAVSHTFVSARWRFDRGFEWFDDSNALGHGAVTSDAVTERGIAYLEAMATLAPAKPFFLWLHYFDVHYDYIDDPAWSGGGPRDYAGPVKSALPFGELTKLLRRKQLGERDLAEIVRLYDAEIARVDAAIGRVLARLRELGRWDATLVAVTADHGEEFLDHGWLGHLKTLHEELVRVPLIVKWPVGVGPAPGVDARPAATIDLMPTLLEVAGVAPRGVLQGQSLLAQDDGEARARFAETQTTQGIALRSIVVGPWKLVRDDAADRDHLYRLDRDPTGSRDLLAGEGVEALSESERAEIAAREQQLRARLDAWRAGCEAAQRIGQQVELSDAEKEALRAIGYGDE